MTRPWQHPPEDQIVAVVHALQELLVCVTDPSELRAVLDGTRGQARARLEPDRPWEHRVTVAMAGRAGQRWVPTHHGSGSSQDAA
jgi:hypothetical protein